MNLQCSGYVICFRTSEPQGQHKITLLVQMTQCYLTHVFICGVESSAQGLRVQCQEITDQVAPVFKVSLPLCFVVKALR